MGEPGNRHREDILRDVRKRGSTLVALAGAHGLHRTTLSHCLVRPIPAANAVIAAFLGRQLVDLWPEWFGKDGKRRPRPDASRNRTPRNPEIAKSRKAAA